MIIKTVAELETFILETKCKRCAQDGVQLLSILNNPAYDVQSLVFQTTCYHAEEETDVIEFKN